MKRRILGYIIALLLLFSAGIWIASRWNVWFSNIPESSFTASNISDRITLTPGEDLMTQRNVSWRCGRTLNDSRLVLVSSTDTTIWKAKGEEIKARGTHDAYYAANIVNLAPGASYKYRVETGDKLSRWYSFKMPADTLKTRRFLYFGDVQDTIGGDSHTMFEKLYKKFNNVDFWACGGDLIERPLNKYWNYLYATTDSIFAMVPILNTAGNHDYVKSFMPHIDERWTKTFVYPENGAKRALGSSYYIDMPDLRIMVLDTHGINSMMTAVSEYQWLKKALQGAEGKWKVVMMHHPIYSVRKGRDNLTVRNTFNPLIQKYGVHLVLQGHEHGYSRYIAENGEWSGNHPVYIVSVASYKMYPTKKDVPGTKIIGGKKMYQTIDYDSKNMIMRAYELDTDKLIDEVKITK